MVVIGVKGGFSMSEVPLYVGATVPEIRGTAAMYWLNPPKNDFGSKHFLYPFEGSVLSTLAGRETWEATSVSNARRAGRDDRDDRRDDRRGHAYTHPLSRTHTPAPSLTLTHTHTLSTSNPSSLPPSYTHPMTLSLAPSHPHGGHMLMTDATQ